ncbi:bifunctional adenosylcobinamide kinase/adenosylcobinamide-phosphate guanylyltransferase [Salinisphaera sp. Q1T1-3]|uniref:bifunctional adenosylcobinamide kinase/adenosylcobinamide-phosphate guanylyltransferase n=1 Tax=Salinisphaera sp. Q1T1-3 TaxID=2321229 RepID=UPI000E76AF01|nr:bifunctional adenosylcobinamide kinase/adenosylcobinamide-phosphate guanylyltransferase [Salinisphaera sp. Q1T1-3]RJS92521.1 bifunctional adenosylcobinamide kinase/adenosylcobinamide-phosphate guanylyltransferase [Salinisphaera sp. Q1T1-3]
MGKHHLVLGGARSGKSRHAEAVALALPAADRHVYVATARAHDAEMARRIAAHRAERDPRWQTVEAPLALGDCLAGIDAPGTVVLVDCLTLWLSNALAADCWATERDRFLDVLDCCDACVVLVSNEVGSGVVPLGQLSRAFVDEAGWLHQALARSCERVELVVAGLVLDLKRSAGA